MRFQFFVEQLPWMDEERLYIREDLPDGAFALVEPLVLTRHERSHHGTSMGPTISGWNNIVRDFLQGALNEAWRIGLRPDGYENATNELKAVRYHLEDMRQLAKVNK